MTTPFITVREATSSDCEAWIDLRASLWPDDAEVRSEAERFLVDGTLGGLPHGVFIAEAPAESAPVTLVGFAECSLRSTSQAQARVKQAHLEGWFVRPEWRRRGIGQRLIGAAVDWARRQRCAMLTSDTTDRYAVLSVPAHQGCGFRIETVDIAGFAAAPEPHAGSIRFSRTLGPLPDDHIDHEAEPAVS